MFIILNSSFLIMKFIIIGSAHPLRGGLASFNERMARELMAMGHEVIMYTFSLQYPNFLFPGKTQYSEDPKPGDLDIRIKINSVNPFNWLRVGKELRKIEPDFVIIKFWLPFMGPCFGSILRNIKKNGKTRVISIIDNIVPHEKRPGDRAFANYFVKPVDRFIVMSRSVEKEMESFVTKQPVVYKAHPVYDNYGALISKEEARSILKLKPGGKYILFFGFIRGYKGLDLLLHAMADPRIRETGIKLIVAGEYYGNQEEHEKIIQEKGISDLLELHTDFIPNDAVKNYFCAADIVVQPYKTATQSGISQLAYHFEKPMVVTNVGGLPEIVGHGEAGYVVPVDVKEIADAILDFYSNNKEEQFQVKVRERKKAFGWREFMKTVLGVEG